MSTASPTEPTTRADRAADSYDRWLRARAVQRPLNPYELLGLEPFESSLARIRALIERQTHDVERRRGDATPELWEAFQREFAAATTILPDPERKALLDAALRRERAAAQGGVPDEAREAEASRLGGAVPCAKCREPNPRDRKFCSACGGSLWDACPKCKAAKLASERFCGHCGQDVFAYCDERNAHYESQLALAERLQAEARFADARRIVREMARLDDPRFERHAKRAARLIEEFGAGQKEQETRVAELVRLAERYVAEHAYETAIKTLRDVPEPLRSPDLQRVFEEARERQQEAERVLASIRAGLEQKQSVQLLPLIERFLTLKPGHAQAEKLAVQIAEQTFARASKVAATGEWAAALEMLRPVPEFARTDALKRFTEDCEERAWLAAEVRQASVLHPSLPAFAERLVELAPGHDEFGRLARELKQRQSQPPPTTSGVHDWRAAPQRSALGLPVEWRGGLRRLAIADDAKWPKARTEAGRWYAALGLALQAVGQAALDVNFTEGEKAGVLSRLTSGFRRKGPVVGWGLDLSGSSLKAVRLRWDESTKACVVEACELFEADAENDGAAEAARDTWASDVLERFAANRDLAGARVAVNLPAAQCLSRFCLLPVAKGKKFDELVKYEAKQQFPMALEDLVWEYVDLRNDAGQGAEAATSTARVMIVAAKRTVVEAREQLFARAGLKPHVVQCDALATHNFFRFEREAEDAAESMTPGILAVLDVGAESTSFTISGPDFAWFRSFATAGDEFTRTAIRELKLVRRQAEQAKRQPHRVRKAQRLVAAWETIFNQLRSECQRSLGQWKTLDPARPPERLVCVGGGVQTYGLVEMLRG